MLQSTKPGRADHDLLIIANQRIDRLIQIAANPHHSEDHDDDDDDELFALYDDYATEEPEEQEKARAGRKAFRDTIMDFYGSSSNRETDVSPTTHDNDNKAVVMDEDGQDLANITPRSVKMLSRIPDIHVANVMIHPSPLSPPPHVDEPSASQSASLEEEDPLQQSSSTEKQSAESTPVQMTYIQPAVHKATLIRHDVDNAANDDDDNDDDDDIPLIPQQQPPVISSNMDNHNNNNQRSSSSQQHAVMQTMESLRSALTASLDSFTDSTHSLQSSYSAPRSSSSTAATETVPNTYIDKEKPSSGTPRSLPLAESPSSNEYQQSTAAPVDHHGQRQESMQLMMNSSSDSIAMQSSVSNFGGGQRDPQERQSHGNQWQNLESPPESVSFKHPLMAGWFID